MRTFLVAALMLLTALAGCSDDTDSSLATAQEALPRAEAQARDWDASAQLLWVSGVEIGAEERAELAEELEEMRDEVREARAECQEEEDDEDVAECMLEVEEVENSIRFLEALLAASGDVVGDGVAPVWIYGFMANGSEDLLVVAASGREVVYEQVVPEGLDDGMFQDRPVTAWEIDSDAATQVAIETDTAYAASVGLESATAFFQLIQGTDRPYWLLGMSSDEGDAFLAVDAKEGDLVTLEEVFGLVGPLLQEAGSDAGSFTPLIGTTASSGFRIEQSGHQALAVHVSVSPMPLEDVLVTITDPNGLETQFNVPMVIGAAGSEAHIVLDAVPTGDYQVDLELALPAQNSWDLSWCSDGDGDFFGFGFDYAACDHVPAGLTRTAPSETVSRWLTLAGL